MGIFDPPPDSSPFRGSTRPSATSPTNSIFRGGEREEETERFAGPAGEQLTRKARSSPLMGANQLTFAPEKKRETNVFKHPFKYYATASPLDIPRDTFNFFFENEMAAFGMKWETTFPTISMEHFKKTWAESPGWNTLGLGSVALMAIPPIYASFKFGKAGMATGKGFRIADKLQGALRGGDEIAAQGAEGYRRLGSALHDPAVVSEIASPKNQQFYFSQFSKYKDTPDLGKYAEVDWLSQFWMIGDVGTWGEKYGSPGLKKALKGKTATERRALVRELSDDAKASIFKNVPNDSLKKARHTAYSQNKWQILEAKKMLSEMPESGVKFSTIDKMKYSFHNNFANSHAQATWAFDPLAENAARGEVMTDIARNMERWNDPKLYGKILDNLPGVQAVDNNWMHHMLYRYGKDVAATKQAAGQVDWINKVPPPSGGLDTKGQNLLDATIDLIKERQQAMIADGMLPESVLEDIPWHFFAGRPATAAADASTPGIKNVQSIARIINPENGNTRHEFVMSVIPNLDSSSLFRRGTEGRDPLKLFERLGDGKLIDNPQDLLLHSVVADGNMWEAHKLTRDILMNDTFATPYAALVEEMASNPATKMGYADLNKLLNDGQKARLVRMIKAKDELAARSILGPNNELPFMKQEWYNDIYGEMGFFDQSAGAANLMDAITTAYKTMKTAMNPTTQVTNIFGNYAFLMQAGMNPLSPTNMQFQADVATQTSKLYKLQKKHNVSAAIFDNWKSIKLYDQHRRMIPDGEIIAQLKGRESLIDEFTATVKPYLKELKEINDAGGFDINYKSLKGANKLNTLALMGDDLAISAGMVDPKWAAMKEFVVTEAHGNVEMWDHLERLHTSMATQAAKGNDQWGARKFVEMMMKLNDPTLVKKQVAHVNQAPIKNPITGQIIHEKEKLVVETLVPGPKPTTLGAKAYNKLVTGTFKNATHLYIQGDVIPKLALFAHNMDQGMGLMGSISEVARRTPMYKHVGSKLKGARRYFMPWVTFPAEAARITKNNLMDHPLRMLPWLKAPQIAQFGAMQLGLLPDGMTREGLMEAIQGAPEWIKETGSAAGGGMGQAVQFGGERGNMAAGIAGGAGIGATVLAAAYALGFGGSPMTAAVKAVGAGAAGGALGGFLMSHSAEADNPDHLRATILNWLPHTAVLPKNFIPGASLSDMMDFAGGTPDKASPVEILSVLKPLLNIMQGRNQFGDEIKNATTMDYMTNAMASYIGMLTPPIVQKYGFKITSPDTVAYLQDVWEPGITAAMGAFYGLAAGGPVGAVAGAATGAAVGAGVINTSRAFIDAGLVRNPYTNEKSPAAHDLFINNLGAFKSYRVHPSTDLFDQQSEKEEYAAVRSGHVKNLRWALENTEQPGDTFDTQARSLTKDIYATFYDQYPDDPAVRMDKFAKWMKPYIGSMGRTAALRGASGQDIDMMLARFTENAKVTGKQMEFWRSELVQLLKKEKYARVQQNVQSIRSSQGSKSKGAAGFARPNLFSN